MLQADSRGVPAAGRQLAPCLRVLMAAFFGRHRSHSAGPSAAGRLPGSARQRAVTLCW